jgi:hypothetical protein
MTEDTNDFDDSESYLLDDSQSSSLMSLNGSNVYDDFAQQHKHEDSKKTCMPTLTTAKPSLAQKKPFEIPARAVDNTNQTVNKNSNSGLIDMDDNFVYGFMGTFRMSKERHEREDLQQQARCFPSQAESNFLRNQVDGENGKNQYDNEASNSPRSSSDNSNNLFENNEDCEKQLRVNIYNDLFSKCFSNMTTTASTSSSALPVNPDEEPGREKEAK